ncbi:MAG: SGNH/GDSL hydrolase family protein [bacterium]|nr:SGNH/GDSL hydrolase family protein [bacterium]
MTTNAHGFRGPTVTLEKAPGTVRIACLGDSYTYGYGVELDATWPARLAAALPAEHEVLNCGVIGYHTADEVLWLEHRVLRFAPDIVILQYFFNDAATRGLDTLPSEAPSFTSRLVHWTNPGQGGAVGRLRKLSRLFDLACGGIYGRASSRVFSAGHERRHADDHPSWQRVRRALLRAWELTRSSGTRLVVVAYPYFLRAPPVPRALPRVHAMA